MLGYPKDIIATTGSEMMNVTRWKKLYIDMQLAVCYGVTIVNHNPIGRAFKWAISSKACSRAIRFVGSVKKRRASKNLGYTTAGERRTAKMPAMNVLCNGIENIRPETLSRTERSVGSKPEGIGQTIKSLLTHVVGITPHTIESEIKTLYTKLTAISVHVAEKQTQNSLLLTMLTATVTSNARAVSIQVVQNSIEELSKTIFRLYTKFFASIAILAERGTAGFAPIKNVQRLLRKQVHPSGWKRLLPDVRKLGNDIVPSV